LGFVEGENLVVERYSAEGHHERYADLARQIVARHPDLIVTGTNPVVTVVRAATRTIPVVAFMLDPLKAGLVTSLARPGGNLTGITLDAGIEIWEKRLQMCLRQPRPHFWVCAAGGKVLLDKSCAKPVTDWELRWFGCSRRRGLPPRLSASSPRWSSNGRTQYWSAGKETFTRTDS
jgi:ABC transporter substrate binding protein